MTEERTREGSRAMTIQTYIRHRIGSIEKMKALLAACLMMVATLLAASLLAPGPAQASAFPGANGKIVFSSDRTTGTGVKNPEGDFEIFSINPDGTALKQLTRNKASDTSASYSSDGKKIVFRSDRTTNLDIFVMNSDGTGQKNLTNDPSSDVRPSFSPDGKKILFDSAQGGAERDVFVMNADGTQKTPLTTDPRIDEDATFSPKGDKIAFVSDRAGDSEIFIMNPDGTQQTPLTTNNFTDQEPSFSPDGSKIAFASNRDGAGDTSDFDIFVMNSSDGSGTLRHTNSRARDVEPAFSPDGKKIAYTSTQDGGDQDVLVMDEADGTVQTDLTPNTVFDSNPDWQPVAATFTVTSDSDPGDGVCNATSCTLREAINASNNLQAQVQNKIKFNISGGGVHTITPPTSPLPQITSPVAIDGYTQPTSSPNTLTTGTNAVLKVELNGKNLPGSVGLVIQDSSNSVIRGLAINRFAGGISVGGDSVANRIEGNFIGTDPIGTLAQSNDSVGVALFNNADGNVIGGTTPASRNLISANALGLELDGTSGNAVLGNLIGTTAGGTGALGNGSYGVALFGNDASNNKIGDGTAAGANTIAFNGSHGIEIDGSSGQIGNAISRNSIFSNAGLGIDLFGGVENAQGTTANDPGDADAGPNNLQNFPVLASAKSSSTTTTISATLNSSPTKTFTVQFFSNPSGNEGKKFIGQKSVTTNGSGSVSFTFSPASKVAVGQTITATATDPAGNTSEFSAARKVASS
jgi:CSLREA domain-containing protein